MPLFKKELPTSIRCYFIESDGMYHGKVDIFINNQRYYCSKTCKTGWQSQRDALDEATSLAKEIISGHL